MLNIALQDAQNKLPELIQLVEQGEEIFILGDNKIVISFIENYDSLNASTRAALTD